MVRSLISLLFIINCAMVYSQVSQHKITGKDVLLNTTVYSKPSAETVILLHGGPGVPDSMKAIVQHLNNKYQVVTFEQRGTGASICNNCRYTIPDYLADIDSIANFLQIDSFHLFGHSWGGLYAQIYAQERPEKIISLFLCSPGSGTNDVWKQTEKEVLRFNKKVTTNREWMSMGWNSLVGKFGSDRAYQRLFAQVLTNYNRGHGNTLPASEQLTSVKAQPVNRTRKNIIQYDSLKHQPHPGFNILITYGDDDIYGTSKSFVTKRYPTAQVMTIPNSGHLPWLHNTIRFNEILNSFYGLPSSQ